ncbi:MAG TPA: DNA-directed RNA polymerase subunit K [Thermoplasmata archaeon]|nr:DNA-directed RNA polymerase subunit K [Thermoplasmata archaeon]
MTAATVSAGLVGTVSDAPSGTTDMEPSQFTRFERARILGARALQVSLGAPILLDVPSTQVDPVEIAEIEYAAGVIPITVRRGAAR